MEDLTAKMPLEWPPSLVACHVKHWVHWYLPANFWGRWPVDQFVVTLSGIMIFQWLWILLTVQREGQKVWTWSLKYWSSLLLRKQTWKNLQYLIVNENIIEPGGQCYSQSWLITVAIRPGVLIRDNMDLNILKRGFLDPIRRGSTTFPH